MKRTPLRPGPAPLRQTPLPRVNRARRVRLEREQYGPHAHTIRSLPCCICGRKAVAAHAARTKGAGGKARDLAPLCADHEREWHAIGRWTFRAKYGIDLRRLAAALWAEYNGGES